IGDHATRVGVDDPTDLFVAQRRTVAFGPDDIDRGEWFARHDGRSSGPNAWGSTSDIGCTPRGVSTRHPGPPNSNNSCRQRPQGINGSPSPERQVTATNRPPPDNRNCPLIVASAHSPTG